MKLVEKKCPNCGAQIKFSSEDDEVVCKYCNTSFDIEKEEEKDDIKNLSFEAFNLHAKMVNRISKGIMVVWAVMFIIFLIVFAVVFFNIFSHMR